MILYQKIHYQRDVLPFDQDTVSEEISVYQQKLTDPLLDSDSINMVESVSAKLYFSALYGSHFKRFSSDTLNAGLNYGYSILRAMIMVSLTVHGIHPTLGIWHHSIRNRFNLADDLIEPLRPLMDQHISTLDLSNKGSLDTECKKQILSILQQPIYWRGNSYSLRTAIDLYIRQFVHFMNKESDELSFIQWKG